MRVKRIVLSTAFFAVSSALSFPTEAESAPFNGAAALEALQSNDFKRALEIAHPLADKNDATALLVLGQCYYFGNGVEKDGSKALTFYRRAADLGNSKAQFYLGVLTYTGDGVEKNVSEAVRWYRMAADNGDSQAAAVLGQILVKGGDTVFDINEGIRYLELAAQGNEAVAEFNLAVLYQNPEQKPELFGIQDLEKSIYWYRRSIEHGNVDSATNLAGLYLLRTGEKNRNVSEAEKLFEFAAKHGDSRAMFNLGLLNLSTKDGIGNNPMEAFAWLSVAQKFGHPRAEALLNSIRSGLSSESTTSANLRTRELERRITKKP